MEKCGYAIWILWEVDSLAMFTDVAHCLLFMGCCGYRDHGPWVMFEALSIKEQKILYV